MPAVYQKLKSHFVTQMTTHCFSMMAHDHGHKQLNAVLKGDNRIIGFTENELALKQWFITGQDHTC